MDLKISPTASFDVEVACKYGHTEALLINHFAHWIRINHRKNVNFKDGRTWMYQTLDEIAENFPYLTKEQVRTTLDHLCTGKNRHSKKEKSYEPLLMKGNYNKLAIDKTTWYAFIDESFLNSNSSYERANAQSTGQMPNRDGQMPTPIPIANKTEATKASSKEEANNRDKKHVSPKSPSLNRKNEIAFLAGFAADLGLYLSEKDLGIWLSKYDLEKIKRNIFFATKRKYKNLERFLQGALENDYAKEAENIELNRAFMKTFSSKHNLSVKITQRYVKLSSDKEIYFNLPPSQFNQALINHYSNQEK